MQRTLLGTTSMDVPELRSHYARLRTAYLMASRAYNELAERQARNDITITDAIVAGALNELMYAEGRMMGARDVIEQLGLLHHM